MSSIQFIVILVYLSLISSIKANVLNHSNEYSNSVSDNSVHNNNNNVNDKQWVNIANNVCLTKACVVEAAKLLETIDDSISPCDDFFQYSCGKWIASKRLPEHKSIINRFSDLSDDLNDKLRNLIVNTNVETETREFIKNAKNYYDSCFNTTILEELGDKPLVDLLRGLGGWPVVEGDNWVNTTWLDLYLKLRDEGAVSSMFFSLSISPDFMNNSVRILSIDHPSFGLGSRDMLLKGANDTAVKAYKNLMTKAMLKLGAPDASVSGIVDQFLDFETLLANQSMAKENRRNLTAIYNKVTIGQLSELAPNIDWLRIVQKYVSENITANETIILFDTDYIKFLDTKIVELDDRFLVNYILWRVVQTELSTLSDSWYKLKEEFESAIYGTKSRSPRWEMCLKNTKTAMSIALSHLYVKNFFSDDNKEKASEMFSNVVKEFKRSLTVNTWMANETRVQALQKLDNIRMIVGYPDELLDESKVSAYYKTLWTNASDYFGNNARLSKWYLDLGFGKLRQPVDHYDWRDLSGVAVVNAYYHQLKNLVVMPAGILQGVFFHKDRPNYLNYGSIAYVSGHEIIHGFDDGGRQYDQKGNLRNWWDASTDTLYKQKADCFINQYANFTVKEVGQHLNGINTQGENIADNGGVIQSYRAYQNYVRKNGVELPLPALNLSPDQLFWVSSAVQYCSKATDQYLALQVMTDSHSPSRQRVNGVVSNSEDFSRLFNCPLGAPMNPVDKCVIW